MSVRAWPHRNNPDPLYEGYGILVDGHGRLIHDLDDKQVIEARGSAYRDIDNQLARAAVGAARITRLNDARAIIEKFLLTREEDRTRRRICADKLLAIMRNTLKSDNDRAEAALRLLDNQLVGMPGIVNKNERIEDTLTSDERSEANSLAFDLINLDDAKTPEEMQEEKEQWVAKQGSDKLKRLIREGIEWERVYLDERLEAERPGWKSKRMVCGKIDPPLGPSVTEKHLLALDIARKLAPDAKLGWLSDGDHSSPCTCPLLEGNRVFNKRLIIYADHIGKTIVLEVRS
jgi:hypothetical protein